MPTKFALNNSDFNNLLNNDTMLNAKRVSCLNTVSPLYCELTMLLMCLVDTFILHPAGDDQRGRGAARGDVGGAGEEAAHQAGAARQADQPPVTPSPN